MEYLKVSQGMPRYLNVYLSQGMRATPRPSPCRWGHIWQIPQVLQDSLIWYKPMYISHVFPQSVQNIAMVSQTTRYVSCSCFWQTIHLEGRGCWVQNHGVDCQHGGGNLMLYTSRYHDINTYIYIYGYTHMAHRRPRDCRAGAASVGCIGLA